MVLVPGMGPRLLNVPHRHLSLVEQTTDSDGALALEIPVEGLGHPGCFCRINLKLYALRPIPERGHAARPLPLPTSASDLVPNAGGDHLPLELREAHEHVQGEPAHRIGRREILGDAHKSCLVAVELLHDLREVQQGPGEPVDLVDQDQVHQAPGDMVHELAEPRTIGISSGEPTVVVGFLTGHPPAACLAPDVIQAGFTLGV